ncbi:hypothetical protein [Actinacidiphila alni]|uniref:hypothetical protein n=1 Tax=Actinacidiphila alni TaxID=380248 RepID=UPI0034551C22
MADPHVPGQQHNHGPGVFIAGDVYGDINNHQTPPANPWPPAGPMAYQGRPIRYGKRPGGAMGTRSGLALLGWVWVTFLTFGASGYCIVKTFLGDPQSIPGELVAAVLLASGGTLASGFVFLTVTEVCAAGTANAADSAMKRWAQGQRAAAVLNLRYARTFVRIARFSSGVAGFMAGLLGFLVIGKQAADRIHAAHALAESEFAKTRALWVEIPDGK